MNAKLAGLRVLLVEDEGTVAFLIEDMLEELGCKVATSVATLTKALDLAQAGTFDFAILDVNLGGQLVFPVAEILRTRKLPFIFSTGYGRVGIPEVFKECQVLNKPYTIEDFETKLLAMLDKGRSAGEA